MTFGLVYFIIVLLCLCVPRSCTIYFVLLWHDIASLFVVKVPLNTNQLTNRYVYAFTTYDQI